ncbi:hypothetical protein ACIQF6_14675 [Kitasatospora sp. NPDC092948]|uniref:hypothetical protein n=1 Tax=Kitasatospora sp. NPDC092948 TaxID=3364088 RepID=UPI0037FEB46E
MTTNRDTSMWEPTPEGRASYAEEGATLMRAALGQHGYSSMRVTVDQDALDSGQARIIISGTVAEIGLMATRLHAAPRSKFAWPATA